MFCSAISIYQRKIRISVNGVTLASTIPFISQAFLTKLNLTNNQRVLIAFHLETTISSLRKPIV